MDKQTDKEEQAVQLVIERFIQAWNKHDIKEFAMLFAKDADFTNVFGQKAQGRQAIEQFHAPLFSTMFKASVLTSHQASIRLISKNLAAVDIVWEMSGATDPQGNPWSDRKGLMNLIMKHENETWSILIMHNMDLPSIPAHLVSGKQ